MRAILRAIVEVIRFLRPPKKRIQVKDWYNYHNRPEWRKIETLLDFEVAIYLYDNGILIAVGRERYLQEFIAVLEHHKIPYEHLED